VTVRILGRCLANGCLTRVNLAVVPDMHRGILDPRLPCIALTWRTPDGRLVQGTMPAEALNHHAGRADLALGPCCVEHRAPLTFAKFKARAGARPCDTRCIRADGGECKCACGGANHGTYA
jgi:hypothetical protein